MTLSSLVSCAILGLSVPAGPNYRASHPITVVLIDDVGWDLLARAHTPNIDAIAARGATFTRAWSYPSCSPTRAALLTGRHATRTGVGSIIGEGYPSEPGLGYHETTIAELLPEAVHAFGKWHVSHRETDPNTQGFEHYAGSLGNLAGPGKSYYKWPKTVDGVTWTELQYVTGVTTDDALASTAGVRYVAYHTVHAPYHNPPGGSAATKGGRAMEMIEHLDRQIGRLFEDYDGYVFLLSDNGTAQELGGGKGGLSEAGVNVPFFVAGPGVVPGVREDLVHVVDLYATIAEMRGVPSNAEDSISFLPVLAGLPGARRFNYVERFEPNGDTTNRQWAICEASYKVRFFLYPVPRTVLYRMPGETVIAEPYSGPDLEAFQRLMKNLPF